MRRKLCIIEGDGVGREVIPAAAELLKAALPEIETVHAEAGWDVFESTGRALPQETLAAARDCGAVLFGAVASPSRAVSGYRSPIIELRQALQLYANLRPTRSGPGGRAGVDLLIVRENTEDLYVGRERVEGERAIAERVISRAASARAARTAFELAHRTARRRVTIIHKANILPTTDGLFRDAARQVAQGFPEIECDEMLVDAAAYWLAREPSCFDVLLTPNLYGDILSDLAAAWAGGLGFAPSLSLGDECALAEPVHGTAPDIAGQGRANPVGAILSAALLARHWWRCDAAADAIERAVRDTLAAGIVTADVDGAAQPVSTRQFAANVLERLQIGVQGLETGD